MSASFKVTLVDGVSRPAKRASKSVKTLGRDMKSVKGAARGSGAGFSMLSSALTAIKVAAGAAAIAIGAIGIKLGASIGQSAAFMEQNRLAFGLLMKGAGAGGQALDEIRAIASDLNLPIQETIKSYRKLLSMQFTPAAAKDVIKLAADMRALGATSMEVGSIIKAMTQIKAKGRLQQEELTQQLAEAGVSAELVYKELGKTLGKTTDQVRKMIEAGKVDADTALDAIKRAIMVKLGTKAPGDAAKAFKSTLGGMWAGIKTQAEDSIITIAERLTPKIKEVLSGFQIPGGTVQRIGDLGDKLLNVVKTLQEIKIPEGAGKVLDDLIERFDIVQTAAEQVKAAASGWLEGFSESWAEIEPLVDSVVEAMLEFAGSEEGLSDIKEAFKDSGKVAAVALGLLVISLGAATAAVRAFSSAWEWLGDVFDDTQERLDSALETIKESALTKGAVVFSEGAAELGTAIVDGIVDGITSGASSVANAIVDLANIAINKAKQALGISSPSKVFDEMGRNIDRGLAGGVRAEQGLVAASTAQTVQRATMSAAATVNHINARVSQGSQTFNVSGATSPEATTSAIQAIQLGDLATALEQLGASMGAAAT
jgi:tape measure domain-containing protein